ncbi:MAG: hypothetical protein V3T84_09635 [Phycisphaerales bacterium]
MANLQLGGQKVVKVTNRSEAFRLSASYLVCSHRTGAGVFGIISASIAIAMP